jgi:hypothetical protein
MAMTIADLSPEMLRKMYGDRFMLSQGDPVMFDDGSLDGPMGDLDVPLPSDYGMENEARRLSKYPAPPIPNMGDSGFSMQGGGGGQPAPAIPQSAPMPEPQNFFQRTTPGNVGPKVSMDYAVERGQPRQAEYSRPIEIAGFGKGYPIKGEPNAYVMNDGKILRLREPVDQKTAIAQQELALKRALTEAQIAKLNRSGQAGPGGMPADLRLEKDQRWNPETQRVEAIPGSKLFMAQKDKFAKDYGSAAQAIDKADMAVSKIDEILDPKNKWGFDMNFGGVNALATQYLPGSYDMGNKIDSLKQSMKQVGLEMMRQGGSIGQMTQAEWPIVERQIESLSPTLTEDEARNVLGQIKGKLGSIAARSKDIYRTEWADSPFYKEISAGKPSAGGPEHKSDWIARAKEKNPGMSGAAIEAEYLKKFGR